MTTNAETSVLDMEIISGIRSLSSPDVEDDLLKELIVLFVDTTPPLLETLQNALVSKDFRVAQRVAHRLKGGSSNVGAIVMSKLCSDIEKLASAQSDIDFEPHCTRLEFEFQTAVSQLHAQVASPLSHN